MTTINTSKFYLSKNKLINDLDLKLIFVLGI